jgi:hypothetical protein
MMTSEAAGLGLQRGREHQIMTTKVASAEREVVLVEDAHLL